MQRIAVLGAGFAGVAVCWFLLQRKDVNITLIDRTGPGAGASGTSAGLLHPYTGPHAKVPWNGLEAFEQTRQLLQETAPHACRVDGILRVAMTEEQSKSFLQTSQNHPKVRWIDDCRTIYSPLIHTSGILIQEGLVVDSRDYLHTLWQLCEARGVLFEQREIVSLDDVAGYDQVVVALGAEMANLSEFAHLRMRQVKGQIIRIKWPTAVPQPSLPITGGIYLVPGDEVIIGATYEKPPFPSDVDFAQKELLPKLYEMIPTLDRIDVIGASAGLRAVLPGHRPRVESYNPRTWIITGFGSKGLLYHALLAKQLAAAL